MPQTWKLGVARIYGLDQAFPEKINLIISSETTDIFLFAKTNITGVL